MSLINKETGQPAPSRNIALEHSDKELTAPKKIQELNQQTNAECENHLSKEALVVYCDKLIDYYLDSDCYFKSFVPWFFDLFDHYGKCENGNEYFFESELYRSIRKRENLECGFHITCKQTDIYQYFNMNYSDEELFAIIFAYWYGLNDKVIRKIADKRRSKSTWHLLNYYLCNRQMKMLDAKNLYSSEFHYSGVYFIWNNDYNERKANYQNGTLKEIDSETYYKIKQD